MLEAWLPAWWCWEVGLLTISWRSRGIRPEGWMGAVSADAGQGCYKVMTSTCLASSTEPSPLSTSPGWDTARWQHHALWTFQITPLFIPYPALGILVLAICKHSVLRPFRTRSFTFPHGIKMPGVRSCPYQLVTLHMPQSLSSHGSLLVPSCIAFGKAQSCFGKYRFT